MKLTPVAAPDHEEVLRVEDPSVGLVGFIAIHSTALGPAAGGLRMRPYASEAEAIEDVLRLSRGMTFKNAAAGLPLGGGKAVIIGNPAVEKPTGLLEIFGLAIQTLTGRYWTAEDMGMTPDDMALVAHGTRFVAGRVDGAYASGDPSPVTARGIFNAIRVTARHRFGSADLEGRRVAVQGVGHVGLHLCALLSDAGADLIVADSDAAAAEAAKAAFGAEVVAPEAILAAEADILAPCAVGAVLNETTIPRLRVSAVAGGANNQLASAADGKRLQMRGILYAPDFVANAGGIINVATEILKVRDRDRFVAKGLAAAEETLDRIFTRAAEAGVSPNEVAEEIVAHRIAEKAA
ncbi:Glu/Leu/Phe/Val family dehydrogenase [Solirhodobacter olei]|uniref:Glu/Leu/Phe/Val family dehydrogenase n=1 Tax=Solirhodobacter olei TaxID=2493082 RepID=UPI000FDAFC74|nr:Glu/Leu/Phe/Val dehydrogenase dimerization domain-containing protein [Solirhodobacter olei]